MISEVMTIFIIAEGLGIIGGLITVYVRLNNKLTTISGNVVQLQTQRSEQREDHKKLNSQVQGMSRTVERHATILKIGDG